MSDNLVRVSYVDELRAALKEFVDIDAAERSVLHRYSDNQYAEDRAYKEETLSMSEALDERRRRALERAEELV